MRYRVILCVALVLCGAFAARPAAAQQAAAAADPAVALAGALAAACRGNETQFAGYFTEDNAAAFHALPANQRAMLMQRFSLSSDTGKPLLSADQNNHPVLRCEAPGGVVEFRFDAPRLQENLAFIPVSVVDSEHAEIGMVREGGSWKLLSLGLVLLDFKQLGPQWAEADLTTQEDAAAASIEHLASTIDHYERAFGKLPESLAQLGPAPKDQISPEQASMVNAALAAGNDGGYRFRYRVMAGADAGGTRYELYAIPTEYGKSGRESFFRDGTGQIHAADKHGADADASDPARTDEKTQ